MIKWQFIIDRISWLISAEGKEIVVFNVEAERDAKSQFEKYQVTCETVKNIFEAVVTASLPGEERIFWVYKDVQFYIKEDEEKVQSTGNFDNIKQIIGWIKQFKPVIVLKANFFKLQN